MSMEIGGIDLIGVVEWVLQGVRLLLVPLLPFPLSAVAQGVADILQALLDSM